MILFLIPYEKSTICKNFFDYLEVDFEIEVFRRLFPGLLIDNGSEFNKVDELELTPDEAGFLVYRVGMFYCDSVAL